MSEFIVVEWPDIQYLMEKDGFQEHAHLIDNPKMVEDFGSSAYFVEKYWLEQVVEDLTDPKFLGIPNISFSIAEGNANNAIRQFQRCMHGFDDSELWNFYVTIAKWITPRLEAFIRLTSKAQSTPCKIDSYEQWKKILEKMLFSFKSIAYEDEIDWSEAKEVEVNEGITLFAKYFFNLWD